MPVITIKAVAHKLTRACYHILMTSETFDVEPAMCGLFHARMINTCEEAFHAL